MIHARNRPILVRSSFFTARASSAAGQENQPSPPFEMLFDEFCGLIAVSAQDGISNRAVFFVTGVESVRSGLKDTRHDSLHFLAQLLHGSQDFLIVQEFGKQNVEGCVELHTRARIALT